MKSFKFKIYLLLLVSGFLFLVSGHCQAVLLYLEPAQAEYYQGDTFMVEIRIDTQGECINTVEAYLSSEPRILEVKNFSQGNSILSLWLQNPEFSGETGLISFIGGIPGGYCGTLPGDPGISNLLGKIIFEVEKESETTEVKFLDSSQVLLNDGFGTPAKLATKGAVFTILSGIPEVARKEWQEELERDKVPPELFGIEIRQDPLIFEGKYFLIFLATDKQTGIDHYEVKEGIWGWKKAVSPYLLKDQDFKSIIKVKAVDKAGNERITEYKPPGASKLSYSLIIILILLVGGIIWWLLRKRFLCKKSYQQPY